jgi:hypothetical protein
MFVDVNAVGEARTLLVRLKEVSNLCVRPQKRRRPQSHEESEPKFSQNDQTKQKSNSLSGNP